MPELKEAAPVDQIPPEAQIMQLAMGGFVCQAVYVAAKLGIADLVSDGPKNIDELAA